MVVYIDENRCTGCGRCVPACPRGALRIVHDVAQIDATRCDQCQACIEACPESAILAVSEPDEVFVQTTNAVRSPTTTTQPTILAEMRKRPLLTALLTFAGREVLPRIVATLLDEAMVYACGATGLYVATATLDVRFRKPAPLETPLRVEGRVTGRKARFLMAESRLLHNAAVVAQARGALAIMRGVNAGDPLADLLPPPDTQSSDESA